MEFFLIEEGKRTGPFQDYDVHERISKGELDGETMAWHRDQKDWLPLKEVAAFESLFMESEPLRAPEPPPLPTQSVSWGEIWMRFFARWTDFVLFQVILLGGFLLLGRSPFVALQSPLFLLAYVAALVVFETLLLTLWGTTPGKWIAGIRIESPDGKRLAPLPAFGRSLRVMVMGMGLWLPFILVVGHLFALWFLRKRGVAPWDLMGTTVCRLPEILPGRVVGVIFALFATYMFNSGLFFVAALRWPDDLPPMYQEPFKELKEEWNRAKEGASGQDPG